MDFDEAQRLHDNARTALTIATQGIEQVSRVLEVYTARDATNAITALKHANPQTPEEQAYNDQLDKILADFGEMGPVATALQTLFAGENRTTMMRLRTDV